MGEKVYTLDFLKKAYIFHEVPYRTVSTLQRSYAIFPLLYVKTVFFLEKQHVADQVCTL